MKKVYVLALVLLATLALTFSGCVKPPPTDDKPTAGTTAPVADPLNGTGGDENACTVHQHYYHTIDGNLIEYVGEDKVDAFSKLYDCSEDFNIVNFAQYCNLTREDFVKAMEWGDKLDHTADDHAPIIGGTAPYTYGEFVDAIFGDDPALSRRIFFAEIFSVADPLNGTCGDENACTVHQFEYHNIDSNLIKYVGQDKMNAFIAAYQDKGEDCNIIAFVNYCNLTREDFVKAMEWGDKLDHTADDHAPIIGGTAPYTYGEFVDAIFGDDPALSRRIFSAEIFKETNV